MRSSSTAVDSIPSEVADGPDDAQEATARRLIVAWQDPVDRLIQPVGMLSFDGQTYSYSYIRNALKMPEFRPFLGFPHLWGRYQSDSLFPLFAQRAMTPRRPDFTRWVSRLGLSDDASPWEQIARSGGRREGDRIQLFPVPTIADGHMRCDFLVHGMRHVLEHELRVGNGLRPPPSRQELENRLSQLKVGDCLKLVDEPSNAYNPQAILATADDSFPLGWIPNLLVEEIHRVPDREGVNATIRAINGPEAGWHLRLLGTLTADVPKDFDIFDDVRWESLAECPHSHIGVASMAGTRQGDELETVHSNWATCADCGQRVPNPLPD